MKRDQVKNLLINKFRNKIGVQPDGGELDQLIRKEVTEFLEHERATEANLIKLDKRLARIMGERGLEGKNPATAAGLRSNQGSQLSKS